MGRAKKNCQSPNLVELALARFFSFPRMGGTDVSIRTCRSTAVASRP